MKKVLSILFAGVIALMATACYPEENFVTFDASKATAPQVSSYEMGAKALSVAYTPGKFNQGFNEKLAVNHMLVITSVDGKNVSKAVAVSNKDNVMNASVTALSNALVALGCQEDQTVSFEAVVRATMQNPSQDNGRNGYVDSKDKVSVSGFVVTFPKGSPYIEYTETSPFSVIGSLSEYGISWDGDLEMGMTEDGNQHVAKSVSLKAGDEFKFRKDQDWAVNYGGEFGSLDTPFAVSQDGPNIVAKADGLYDLWLDIAAGTATLTEAYQAYPDHKEASNWSVIGSLSEYGISWDGDITMLTDGTTHVAQGVKLAAADEFKFRQDKGWAVNLGGEYGSLGSDFSVTQDGPSSKVGADGVYDLIVNPAAGTAQIVETLGGGVSGKIGGDEPEPGPEPTPVTGWNIIGLNGDWNNDIIATNDGSLWTAYITATEDTEFKWRKDAGWDENYGGVFAALGEPFTAEPGGDNIKVAAGFWKVVLDTEALTITISEGDVWSLIGDFNSWGGDVDMTLVDGKWVSPETVISGGFKIRHNHDWALNMGGTLVNLGEPFEAKAGGDNISVEEGTYVVTYDPEAATITVTNAKKLWSLIGVNGDWNTDCAMTEVAPGIWVSDMMEITTAGWKIRFDKSWDNNRGGATPDAVGKFLGAFPGGDNINLTGTFKVVYNANNETIGTLGWGVVGSIASIPGFSWNNDIPMNLASDGKWYSVPVALGTADEIKIRWQAGWDVNRGGDMTAVEEAFDAVAGGNNIKVSEAGTYMLVYDPANEKITVTKAYWGLIGEFNNWGGDVFMMYDGAAWVAYNQTLAGGWKLRQACGWDVNRGGTFVEAGTAFDAVAGGDNINVGELTGFAVSYDPVNEKITVSK